MTSPKISTWRANQGTGDPGSLFSSLLRRQNSGNNSGSFENEALENEDRSTKHPNLENEAPYLENEAPKTKTKHPRSKTKHPISKTRHPKLENEDP